MERDAEEQQRASAVAAQQHKQEVEWKNAVDEATADMGELLSLIDALSVSSVGARSIIESFILQVGGDQLKGKSSGDYAVSERIALALDNKRVSASGGGAGLAGVPTSSAKTTTGPPRASHGAVSREDPANDTGSDSLDMDVDMEHRISPQERRALQSLNVHRVTATSGSKYSVNKSPSWNREAEDNPAATTASAVDDAPLSPSESILNDQYQLARKLHAHQLSQSKITSKMNLNLHQLQMDHINSKSDAAPPASRSSSPSPSGGGAVDDWQECLDPRSQRTYYYSATLKKSTWTAPSSSSSSLDPPLLRSNSSSTIGSSSRSSSPYSVSTVASQSPQLRPSKYSSPSPSVSDRVGSSSRSGSRSSRISSRSSSRSRGQGQDGSGYSVWETATDPKSKRQYYFNKETNVSTWRRPLELM